MILARTLTVVVAVAVGGALAAAAPRGRTPGRKTPVAPARAVPAAPEPDAPDEPAKRPTAPTAPAAEATRCAACHVAAGWEKVRFNHDPTGFPLRGAHVGVACGGCHPRGFDVAVTNTCSGCHRDRHAGEFGQHCEGCHDDASWKPLFQADAHRRTNFPLAGKHAVIPCQQCHGNMRDRTFTRASIGCAACHQMDYDLARLQSIDHAAAGFSLECQSCHSTWRFWPARFERHDTCFRTSSGEHHGIRCLGCHSSLGAVTITGACATGTATCSGCHEHACARSDAEHRNVMGYECRDQKCYECHKLTGR